MDSPSNGAIRGLGHNMGHSSRCPANGMNGPSYDQVRHQTRG